MKIFAQIKRIILDTLFPPYCVSCKKEGDFLCNNCLAELKKRKIVKTCRGTSQQNKEFTHIDGLIYALDYAKNPQIKAAISQFKYKFTQEMADYFGDLLVEKIGELSMTKNKQIILIPVPLHKKRENYRGFNQSEVICKKIKERLGNCVTISHAIKRTKNTSQQAKLNKKERHENLENAFIINKKARFENRAKNDSIIFIVDDVCTTGSTLENCAMILKDSNIKKVYGLVVARAFK